MPTDVSEKQLETLLVDYINAKCNKITSLISEMESEIDYLKE